jgi:lipopolysaccharide export system permease protein
MAFRLRFHQILATPLLFAAMSVLAAAFSLRLMRLGGLVSLAASGVALGFGFFFFNELCSALAKAEVLHPAVAAWTPPLVALLAGFTLLCYTEDG